MWLLLLFLSLTTLMMFTAHGCDSFTLTDINCFQLLLLKFLLPCCLAYLSVTNLYRISINFPNWILAKHLSQSFPAQSLKASLQLASHRLTAPAAKLHLSTPAFLSTIRIKYLTVATGLDWIPTNCNAAHRYTTQYISELFYRQQTIWYPSAVQHRVQPSLSTLLRDTLTFSIKSPSPYSLDLSFGIKQP